MIILRNISDTICKKAIPQKDMSTLAPAAKMHLLQAKKASMIPWFPGFMQPRKSSSAKKI